MAPYFGSCHCGLVRFRIDAEPDVKTVCNCSICTKKNAVMVGVHESELVVLSGAEHLSTYQFNTMTAEHHFCDRCGVYTFHRKRSDPSTFGINVFCLAGFDVAAIPTRHADGTAMSIAAGDG